MPLGAPLLDTLERMRCGGVLLDVFGAAIRINPTAARLLRDGAEPAAELDWTRSAVKSLLGKAGTRFKLDDENWVVVSRENRRPLAIHAVPLRHGVLEGVHTALILIDLEDVPVPRSRVLQQVFGLTPAEAGLAISIVRGETPADIAQLRKVSMATVRSQLASVFSKTNTKGQVELVTLLARVALLP